MNNQYQEALRLKRILDGQFFRKGIAVAVMSGLCYGLFTAFLNLGMSQGVWASWHESGFSVFVMTYILGALGSTVMYFFSAVWSVLLAIWQGKFKEVLRTLPTRPGRRLMLLALLSGPIAGTSYVIAVQKAGAIVTPITCLCPAIGSVLSRFLYRQPLTLRTGVGIIVCFFAGVMLAGEGLSGNASDEMVIGVFMACVAAFIWGLEGCVAGYSTAMVDYQIGICLRQMVSALTNLLLVLPLLAMVGGATVALPWHIFAAALTDGASLWAFVLSGFFAMFAYSLWYKGNSMCGTALGMACNATYAFWGPLFCWLILGVGFGQQGWDIPLIGWLSAVVMVVGIFIIAVDPRILLKRGDRR